MSNKKDNITFISTILAQIFFESWKLFVPFIISKSPYTWILNKQTKYFVKKYSKNKVDK